MAESNYRQTCDLGCDSCGVRGAGIRVRDSTRSCPASWDSMLQAADVSAAAAAAADADLPKLSAPQDDCTQW